MNPIPVVAVLLIAFSIGSNDTSNAFGICIGAGVISFRKAIYLLGVLVFLGVFLEGKNVMRTVGEELVRLNVTALSVALVISAIVIIASNWKRLPVSSHQAIIGSLIGSAMAFGMKVSYSVLVRIVESWAVSPLGSMVLAMVIYKILEISFRRLPAFKVERILRALLLMNGMIIAFNTGANELATALGAVVHAGIIDVLLASILGSSLLWLGAMVLSGRVIETVGKGITTLDAFTGFSAQFSAGISVLIFTELGMPVSTTYCIIGGIVGVGLLKGVETIRIGLLRDVMLSWIVTPLATFLLAFSLAHLILL